MSAAPPRAAHAALDSLLGRFMQIFRELRQDSLHLLDEVYDEHVLFEDPLHRVEGRAALRAYFDRMYAGVESIDFEYGELLQQPGQAMLTWTMRLRHRRLRPGELLTLPGASHLRFADRVHYHRDYFDAGALIYERLPLLGGVVRAIRHRV